MDQFSLMVPLGNNVVDVSVDSSALSSLMKIDFLRLSQLMDKHQLRFVFSGTAISEILSGDDFNFVDKRRQFIRALVEFCPSRMSVALCPADMINLELANNGRWHETPTECFSLYHVFFKSNVAFRNFYTNNSDNKDRDDFNARKIRLFEEDKTSQITNDHFENKTDIENCLNNFNLESLKNDYISEESLRQVKINPNVFFAVNDSKQYPCLISSYASYELYHLLTRIPVDDLLRFDKNLLPKKGDADDAQIMATACYSEFLVTQDNGVKARISMLKKNNLTQVTPIGCQDFLNIFATNGT